MPHSTQEGRTKGILWMLATMACFIALDAVMKWAMGSYSLVQVTWGRFFFATVFAVLFSLHDLRRTARSNNIGFQLVRSCLLMTTTGLFNAGVIHLPLATATSIMFMSPIIVTLLSIALLGERVGIRRWFGIAVGFLGAVIIVRPWQSLDASYSTGVFFMLAASFTNACYQIATRRVRNDDAMTSLLYTAAAGAVVTSALLPAHWSMPDAFGWVLLICSGFAGCIGHLCLIQAFRAAPASVVAPFSYSSLLWATVFGYAIWQEIPDAYTWAGASLIIAAGLYIFLRETKLSKT